MITNKRVKRDIPEKLYYLQTPYKTVWCVGMPPHYGKSLKEFESVSHHTC